MHCVLATYQFLNSCNCINNQTSNTTDGSGGGAGCSSSNSSSHDARHRGRAVNRGSNSSLSGSEVVQPRTAEAWAALHIKLSYVAMTAAVFCLDAVSAVRKMMPSRSSGSSYRGSTSDSSSTSSSAGTTMSGDQAAERLGNQLLCNVDLVQGICLTAVIFLLASQALRRQQQQGLQQQQQLQRHPHSLPEVSKPLSLLLQQVSCSDFAASLAVETVLVTVRPPVDIVQDWLAPFLEAYVGLLPLADGQTDPERQVWGLQAMERLRQQPMVVNLCLHLGVALMAGAAGRLPDCHGTEAVTEASATDGKLCLYARLISTSFMDIQQRGGCRDNPVVSRLAPSMAQSLHDQVVSMLPKLLHQIRSGQLANGQMRICAAATAAAEAGYIAIRLADNFSLPSGTLQQSSAAGSGTRRAAAQLCCVLQDFGRTAASFLNSLDVSAAGGAGSLAYYVGQQLHGIMRFLCMAVLNTDTSEPSALVQAVAATRGVGSSAALQLYGLLVSLLKAGDCALPAWQTPACVLLTVRHVLLAALARGAPQTQAVQCTSTAAVAASSSAAESATSSIAACPASMGALPWLVLLGRCCLQGCGAGLVCVSAEAAVGKLPMPHTGFLVEPLDWLEAGSNAQQLAALGYDVQVLRQHLQALQATAESVVHGDGIGPGPAIVQQQMQAVGQQLTSLAICQACNNPWCNNTSGPSEAALVGGRSSVCSGCSTARYCSKQCQRAHWKQHKLVCKALAEVAAAHKAAEQAVGC